MRHQELIELAEKILNTESGPDTILEEFNAYTSALDVWLTQPRTEDPEIIKSLLENHDKVVKKALSLKDEASVELRKLKAKGKGILAYVDILPKRISFGTKKKG